MGDPASDSDDYEFPEFEGYNDELLLFSPLSERVKYTRTECVAALRGVQLPPDIATAPWDVKLCVLRGIRHHPAFAAEIRPHLAGLPLEFTRTVNARAIMSNEIPDMEGPDQIPYCIWYPDVALEATYRMLVERYPQMRYQVGRACAVAGYDGLYRELNVRPDISIAEEAQENMHQPGSRAIFDLIVAQPTRWCIMDDYTRRIALEDEDAVPPARFGLNGDTAVRSFLDLKHQYNWPGHRSHFRAREMGHSYLFSSGEAPLTYNITEDWNIDEFTSRLLRPTPEIRSLLWRPLPDDLPAGNKDILILLAAYHGDVERYTRLRRPHHPCSAAEETCIIRGIHHSTPFARWWFQRQKRPSGGLPWDAHPPLDAFNGSLHHIHRACRARLIMADDLSCLVDPDGELETDIPCQIWYPRPASAATYLALARRFRGVAECRYVVYAAARAMVVAGYYEAWTTLLDEFGGADLLLPVEELFLEAEAAPDLRFLADLHRMREERSPEVGITQLWRLGEYSHGLLRREATRRWVDWAAAAAKRREGEEATGATATGLEWSNDGGMYGEGVEDVSEIEQFLAKQLGVPGVDLESAPTLSLNAPRPVQLSPTISFQSIGIAPGEDHRLTADPGRTLIFKSSRDTDRITLEGDTHGEDALVIAPGESCTVTNVDRADVVLHVTSVAGDLTTATNHMGAVKHTKATALWR